MSQKVLVSGIKPTGELTLGNYIGALKQFIDLQNHYNSYFFVADLHALTTGKVDPKDLYKKRRDIVALYLACGLDPQKSTIFYQSDIYEHSVAQWLLTSEIAIGELSRMTQFKDKAQKVQKQENGTEKIPVGLLMYPVLMAADIMIYNADVVPVGEDQIQHLELTKTLIQRFNKHYKTEIKVPKAFIPPVGARIMNLQDPTSKMSKSENNKATIYLFDEPQKAYDKIMKSVTDSENKVYIAEHKHGIVNLLNIYAALENITLEEAETKFKDANYFEFKSAVAQSVKNTLINIQSKYQVATKIVDQVVAEGKQKAQQICGPIVQEMLTKMGFK